MSSRNFSISTVATTTDQPDRQAALHALRNGIDEADRALLESIAARTQPEPADSLAATFAREFRGLFPSCPQKKAEEAARHLVAEMQTLFPWSLCRASIAALINGFSHRAQVRQHKNQTRDAVREQEMSERWCSSSTALAMDPQKTDRLLQTIIETSVRMQEIQVPPAAAP
ncbi:hypothetical protein A2454_00375 [Candidatus Peribacteria bacterium RIFOXYC2_FULL_55_14]|nr:MAG: hypothetical protein A2454_00375 [Candidatus Peribacteria bacterium RIFOXYC2_FULL_55_14]